MKLNLPMVSLVALIAATPAVNATTFDIMVTYVPAGQTIDNGEGASVTEDFSARQKQLFGAAETFWETVLTGFAGESATYSMIASLQPEDGFDGSLAFAGPKTWAPVDGTSNPANGGDPFIRATDGYMQFDANDFGASVADPQAEQLFLDSAIHEMAHALGFGTLFEENGLLDTVNLGPDDAFLYYTGTNALDAFNAAYVDPSATPVTSILLQAYAGHWDECWVLGLTDSTCVAESADVSGYNDLELMTAFAVDVKASFSPATIGAFRDLGYTTIDPFDGQDLPDLPGLAEISAVPLPAGGLLLLSGLGGMIAMRRKRKA